MKPMRPTVPGVVVAAVYLAAALCTFSTASLQTRASAIQRPAGRTAGKAAGRQQAPAKPGPPKIDPTYSQIANATGGQAFALDPSELQQGAEVMKFTWLPNSADILIVADQLGSATRDYSFPVDSSVGKLVVSVSGTSKVALQRPDQNSVQPGEPGVEMLILKKAAFCSVENPDVGSWRVNIQGAGDFSLLVKAKTSLDLMSFDFVELRGRPGHQGYFKTHGYPLPDVETAARASISGDLRSAQFELRTPQGKTIQQLVLASIAGNSEEYFGFVTPPNSPFRVYVTGANETGEPFQRAGGAVVSPQPFKITPSATQQLRPGEPATYTFQVTNFGDADRFRVVAWAGQDVVRRVTPASLSLGRNQSAEITVELQLSFGGRTSTNTLVLTVNSETTGGSNSAIVESPVSR